ncbi:MAG TPA: Clp protease N-terminal domain-containing protein [Acidimicrobiia bacterium]|jgi:hypothetical protein
MAPAPTLQVLISVVEADSAGADSLGQLAAAVSTASELTEVSDALLDHFVDQCRRDGRTWNEISGALGVSRQAAHKRFTTPAPTFERFTERARAVLRAAGDTARDMGHNYVGTEHLLLGLFAPAEGIAAQVLVEVGATRERVAEKVRALLPPIPHDVGPERPPYTPRAKHCLAQALAEALGLGHNYIGTEHLLLGLFADEESVAAKVLRELDVDRERCRELIITKLSGFKKPEA